MIGFDWPRSLLSCLLALLAGGLACLSLAPFNLWPLGIISVAVLAYLLYDLTPKQASVCSFFYGLGLFGSGISWIYVSIHVYGYVSVSLAVVLTGVLVVGFAALAAASGYLYVRWIRDAPGGLTLGFAALWVLSEWFRSWFLTGLPWLYLGYAHIDTPLSGWAPVSGVWAISFVVAYTGAVFAQMIRRHGRYRVHGLAVVGLWLFGWVLSMVPWVMPADHAPIEIAMVQANIPQEVKWHADQYEQTLQLYRDLSAPLWKPVDIVIWPEAAIPNTYQNASGFLASMAVMAREHQAHLITGIPYFEASEEDDGRYYNSIIVLGESTDGYAKRRLVPFGEYVPFESWLRGAMAIFDLPLSAFSPGPAKQSMLTIDDVQFAPFICYEIAYPHHSWSNQWSDQADVLVTISNDAWFGRSIGPWQHLQIAQMRALELGRYLIRATGSGVSAIIDQRGHIIARTDLLQQAVLMGEVLIYQGATPFAWLASWPLLVLCLVLCGVYAYRTSY